MGSLALSLGMLIAFLPVVAAVHELGHIAGGRLGGYYVAAAGLGGGRRFLTLPLGRRFNLFVGPLLFTGGATIAFPGRIPTPRWAAFTYHYGGIVAQLGLQAALHLLFWHVPEARPYLLPGIALNGLVVVVNLLPYRLPLGSSLVASDGARALSALAARDELGPQSGLGEDLADAVRARLGTDVARFVLTVCQARARSDDTSVRSLRSATPPPHVPRLYLDVFEQLRDQD